MSKKRFEVIDFLRGLAIIIVVFTHTLAYFLSQKKIFFIWDVLHFTVPIFVFCSSYVFYQFPPHIEKEGVFNYFKKRLLRLLIPYWIFLIPLFLLTKIYEPKKINLTELLKNITFTGGAYISWLVLLFIYLMIFSPLIFYFYKKNRPLLILYSVLAFISSLLFLFYSPKINYLLTMWLPWSLLIIFSFYFADQEKKKAFFLKTIFLSLLVFFLLRYVLSLNHHTLVLQYNKYPPNLYYLSYGAFWISFLYFFYQKVFFRFSLVNRCLVFFSRSSYEIFFSHFLVIYVVSLSKYYKHLNYLTFSLVVFVITIIVQLVLNYIKEVSSKRLTIVT